MQMLGESAGVGPLVGDVDRHRKGRRAKSRGRRRASQAVALSWQREKKATRLKSNAKLTKGVKLERGPELSSSVTIHYTRQKIRTEIHTEIHTEIQDLCIGRHPERLFCYCWCRA